MCIWEAKVIRKIGENPSRGLLRDCEIFVNLCKCGSSFSVQMSGERFG